MKNKNLLVLTSKGDFSVLACEFIRIYETPVSLTEDQMFWHRLYDKALDEVKSEKDSLLLKYLSSLSSINLNETLSDEEKSEAAKMVTDDLGSDLCQLNYQVKKKVMKMATEKSSEHLNCVQKTEEEQFFIPQRVSLHEAFMYPCFN